jgi:hypothetical protein
MSATTMIREENARQTSVCSCGADEGDLKTYYVWLTPSNEKLKVEDVVEITVTQEAVLFARVHEFVSIPRDRILMVTCEVCSAPPFS